MAITDILALHLCQPAVQVLVTHQFHEGIIMCTGCHDEQLFETFYACAVIVLLELLVCPSSDMPA